MNKYKIDVFIPVGGIGKRLGGITNNIPKPLIKINNNSFIRYVINDLLKTKINNLYLLTFFKSEKFSFLKKAYKNEKFELKLINDDKRKGTFNSLYRSRHKIKNDFIYSNADEILDINLNKLIKIFKTKKIDILQLYFKDKNGVRLENEKILNKKLHSKKNKYTEGGLKLISKKIFKKSKIKKFQKIEEFISYNKNNLKLHYFIIKEKPYSIDTWKRIVRTKKYLIKFKY